jgi:hypothetical protein
MRLRLSRTSTGLRRQAMARCTTRNTALTRPIGRRRTVTFTPSTARTLPRPRPRLRTSYKRQNANSRAGIGRPAAMIAPESTPQFAGPNANANLNGLEVT